jgi:hypothetical protein
VKGASARGSDLQQVADHIGKQLLLRCQKQFDALALFRSLTPTVRKRMFSL